MSLNLEGHTCQVKKFEFYLISKIHKMFLIKRNVEGNAFEGEFEEWLWMGGRDSRLTQSGGDGHNQMRSNLSLNMTAGENGQVWGTRGLVLKMSSNVTAFGGFISWEVLHRTKGLTGCYIFSCMVSLFFKDIWWNCSMIKWTFLTNTLNFVFWKSSQMGSIVGKDVMLTAEHQKALSYCLAFSSYTQKQKIKCWSITFYWRTSSVWLEPY